MKILLKNSVSRSRLLLFFVAMVGSQQGYAMSCRAGTTDGSDTCSGADFSASVETFQPRGSYDRFGSAYVNARTGAMGSRISLTDSGLPGGPSPGNGQAGVSFAETFRINGPSVSTPLMAKLLFGVSGDISGNCASCSGDMSFYLELAGANFSGFKASVSGVRTLAQPDWIINPTLFGLSSSASVAPGQAMGSISFDISSKLGFEIQLKGELSTNVAFLGANPNPEGASITSDASHTALFNIILPEGYSLTPKTNVNFLAAPQLQAVPIPGAAWLFATGLFGLIAPYVRISGR